VSEQRQPRVLHIGKYLPPVPGGIETYLGDLLRVSMRQGLEVGAVVHGKNGYPDPNPADFGGAKIYTVPTYGQVLYAPVAPMFPWVLRKAIREFKPDVLHMHVPNTSAFWALFIPEARKIPWVLHWHADVDGDYFSVLMRLVQRPYAIFQTMLLRKSKKILATSEEYLLASNPLRPWLSKCSVIPLGIDLDRLVSPNKQQISVAAKMWSRPDETRFLAVGRLVSYKGYEFLIDAFQDVPSGSLVIVGEGALRTRLDAQIKSLGLSHRIKLVGHLSGERLAACYSACDVFCMTSIDRGEAYGVALLEAACFGAKIIAPHIEGSATGRLAASLGGRVFATGRKQSFLEELLQQANEAPRRPRARDHSLVIEPRLFLENYNQIGLEFSFPYKNS
jgi:glycosyltransferase involved in cell wall biosynthesis